MSTQTNTEQLEQEGFIDALIEHYVAHQERYKNADPETQELDYDSFITEWQTKLAALIEQKQIEARMDELFWLNRVYRQRRDKSLIGMKLDELRDIDKDLDEVVDRIKSFKPALKKEATNE